MGMFKISVFIVHSPKAFRRLESFLFFLKSMKETPTQKFLFFNESNP